MTSTLPLSFSKSCESVEMAMSYSLANSSKTKTSECVGGRSWMIRSRGFSTRGRKHAG